MSDEAVNPPGSPDSPGSAGTPLTALAHAVEAMGGSPRAGQEEMARRVAQYIKGDW